MWGERGYGDGSNPYEWLSRIALLPWLPGFPPQAFPTTISSLTSPQSVSLQSTAALALRLLHNPQTSAPSRCSFQETCVPAHRMYGCGKDCQILIPFAAAAAKLLQSCLILCESMDSSSPGSSVHGILQARILEWVAFAFSTHFI